MRTLDLEEIKRVIGYDPITGVFTWILPQTNSAKEGAIAGSRHTQGYVEIQVLGKRWLAHRLAFYITTGRLPENQIDHIDRDRSDNRWTNLREATNSQNGMNRVSHGESGCKNVYLHKPTMTYNVKFTINGKIISFGYYKDVETADKVAKESRKQLHKQFARD